MTEEKDQSAEELRRKIQERLNSINSPENKEENSTVGNNADTKPKETVVDEKKADPPTETQNVIKQETSTEKVKIEESKKATSQNTKRTANVNTKKDTMVDEIESTENIKQKSKSSVIFLLIFLLVGVTSLFVWQFMQNSKTEDKNVQLITENDNLKDLKTELNQQLQDMLVQYEGVKTSNKELNATLQEEKQKIKDLLQQVDKLEGKAAKMEYFKRQVKSLEQSQAKYLQKIDSLAQLNLILVEKNEALNTEVTKTQTENQELSGKVAEASKVRGVNLGIKTYNAKAKLNEKNKASKTAVIETCVTLVANPLAKTGTKDLYVRIVAPGGKIIIDSKDNLFRLGDEEVAFTALGQVDYQNQEISTCIKYTSKNELAPGNYDIEVFAEGVLLGSKNLLLID